MTRDIYRRRMKDTQTYTEGKKTEKKESVKETK
jgi:hypothetical protein